MNILIITATYTPSINGVAINLARQKKEFEKRGHNVTLLAPHHPEQRPEKNVIRLASLPNPIYPDYPLILPIPKIFILHRLPLKIDLIYFHHPFHIGRLALSLAKHYACPSIFFFHTNYVYLAKVYLKKLTGLTLFSKHFAKNITNIMDKASHILVETGTFKRKLLKQTQKTPITVITTLRFSEIEKNLDKPKLVKKYGIAANSTILLCVSRLAKEKNLSVLIKIVSRLLKSNKKFNITFLLAGAGPEDKNLLKLVNKLNLLKVVKFLGPVKIDKISEIYSLSDIFIYSSKADVQALVILEALIHGLPIVAFKAPGPKDFINHGKNGFLVKSQKEFVEKLGILLRDSKKREKFSGEAAESSKKYSSESSIDKTEKLFLRLISNKS